MSYRHGGERRAAQRDFIINIHTVDPKDPYRTRPLRALVDTGAGPLFISRQKAEEMRHKVYPYTKAPLYSVQQLQLDTKGLVRTQWRLETRGETLEDEFLVTDGLSYDVLVGTDRWNDVMKKLPAQVMNGYAGASNPTYYKVYQPTYTDQSATSARSKNSIEALLMQALDIRGIINVEWLCFNGGRTFRDDFLVVNDLPHDVLLGTNRWDDIKSSLPVGVLADVQTVESTKGEIVMVKDKTTAELRTYRVGPWIWNDTYGMNYRCNEGLHGQSRVVEWFFDDVSARKEEDDEASAAFNTIQDSGSWTEHPNGQHYRYGTNLEGQRHTWWVKGRPTRQFTN
ncbi:hypothetical protein E8E11_010180 [Didymella keratinophila]|nr:hypothetical protein E8E11_010180 [Didymella keratinophila]